MDNDSLHISDSLPASLNNESPYSKIPGHFFTEYSSVNDKEEENLNKENIDWMFFVLLAGYIIITLVNVFNRKRLVAVVRAFFAKRLVMQISREGSIISEGMSFSMFLIFISSYSLFIYLIIDHFLNTENINYWGVVFYIEIFIGLLLFLFFKFLLIKITEVIFKTKELSSAYLINYYVFLFFEGIIVLPLITLIIYLPDNYSKIILIGSIILMTIVYLFRLYRGIFIGLSSKKYNLFQLFLYLCTHEIIPVLLIAKFGKDYLV